MSTVELYGYVTETGDLEVEPQPGLRPGRVRVTIDELNDDELPWEERPWTADELRELMTPDPKSGAEIAAMIESGELDTSAWVAMNITDPVAWLEAQRTNASQERIRRE